MTTPPAIPIPDNVPCDRCGYNLRTLLPDANCPECGLSVGHSLRIFNRGCLNRRQLLILAWGALSCAIALVASFVLLVADTFHLNPTDVFPIIMLFGSIGAWLCTAPVCRMERRHRLWMRHAGRWLIVVPAAACTLMYLRWALSNQVLLPSLLLAPVGAFLVLSHVIATTRRMPWPRLHRALSIDRFLLALVAGLIVLSILFPLMVRDFIGADASDITTRFTRVWIAFAVPVTLFFADRCRRAARHLQ